MYLERKAKLSLMGISLVLKCRIKYNTYILLKGKSLKLDIKLLRAVFWGVLPLYNFDVLPPSSWLEILFLRALVSQTLETC